LNEIKKETKTKTRRKTIKVYLILLCIIVVIFIALSVINLVSMFTPYSLVFLVIFIALSILAGYIGFVAYRNIGKVEGKKERITIKKFDSLMAKKNFTDNEKKILLDLYKPIDEKEMFKYDKKMVSDKDQWNELKKHLFNSMIDTGVKNK